MIISYRYRLYPTKKQVLIIDEQLNLCRWLYNTALDHRITAYRKLGQSITLFQQCGELTVIRKEIPAFKGVYSQVLQDVLRRLDRAYKVFFKQIKGFPRFKSKNRFRSLTYPQKGFRLKGDKLKLSKIGLIRIKLHRQIPNGAKIKTCTITKSMNQWYVGFSVECNPKSVKQSVGNAVGIDLGLYSFATLSDGNVIDNPRYYRKSQDRLNALQSKFSKNRSRTNGKALTSLYRKVSNQRKDFLHKESRKLVNRYDLIAHEDLNIKGMVHGNLSKSIYDAGWGTFIRMLTYKAEDAGKYVIPVNPYHTSQTCSNCGTLVKKKLADRQHECPDCGLSMNRDLNAAHNILKLGTSFVT